jgi:hypothetical protein
MTASCIQKFSDPLFLRRIGRPLLEQFLRRFEPSLAGGATLLPPPRALDQEFFNLMAHLLMIPEGLPDAMREALHTIGEMAGPDGQERIEQVTREAGRTLTPGEDCSREDIAMHLWLEEPALLARARNLHRLSLLRTFHHFGCAGDFASASRPRVEMRSVAALRDRCEQWFASHRRGRQNTRIECYEPRGEGRPGGEAERWFLIRHGDTCVRAPRIDRGETEVIHFRPAKDDVVVFNPARRELRINARTLGERDLYRAAFGEHIFDSAAAFSERRRYTLDPLLTEGRAALDAGRLPDIRKVVLRGVEAACPGAGAPRLLLKAGDVFEALREGGLTGWPPESAELTHAWFDLYFKDAAAPRSMQLRPPNTLRLPRNVNPESVETWFAERGFRVSAPESPATAGGANAAGAVREGL